MTKPTDTQELELGEILTKFGRTYWHQTSNRQANVISPGEAETHINIARETAAKLIEQNYILKSQVLAAIPEKNVNQLEKIIADHNKEMRTDMASEITGGTRSKAITNVITVEAILKWHSHQIKSALGLEEGK